MTLILWRDICRVCGKHDESMPINFEDSKTLEDCISIADNLLNTTFANLDRELVGICNECNIDLRRFLNFSHKCKKVQEMIMELAGEGDYIETILDWDSMRLKYGIIPEEEDLESLLLVDETNTHDSAMSLKDFDYNSEVENIQPAKINIGHESPEKRRSSVNEFETVFLEEEEEDITDLQDLNDDPPPTSILKISSRTQGSIVCHYCSKHYSKKSNLTAHIRNVHENTTCPTTSCADCGKQFANVYQLSRHKLTHTEDRPFVCEVCSKAFKEKTALTVHIETHGNPNYICAVCGLHLNSRRTLNQHMIIHSDEKKYKCNICSNAFKRSKSLKAHLILHMGLRPYKCPFCDKSFAHGSNCRSHKKRKHPVELAAMEASGESTATVNIPRLNQIKSQLSKSMRCENDINAETMEVEF